MRDAKGLCSVVATECRLMAMQCSASLQSGLPTPRGAGQGGLGLMGCGKDETKGVAMGAL